MELLPHRTKVILAYTIIYFVWGSTFFAVHIALNSFPPFLLSALRLLVAGLALAGFCAVRGESIPSVKDLARHAVCGLVVFIGGIVAVVWAQQFVSSSIASAIITTPFWFIVLDKQQWKYYFSNQWIVSGLICGLIGVVLLMSFKTGRAGMGSEAMQTLSIAIIIIGSFLWVAGALYLKYNPTQSSVYVNTSIQLISAGSFCVILSYLSNEWSGFKLESVTYDAVASMFYLSIVSSLLGFLSFMWLIKVQPPAIVSTYSYVNPLVATVLGWAFLNEHISMIQTVALGVILIGVFFVNIPRYQAMQLEKSRNTTT